MVDMLDRNVRIFRRDHLAEGRAIFGNRLIRHRREGRPERCEAVEGGFRPRIFFVIQYGDAVFVADRHQAPREAPLPDRRRRARLAFKRQLIERFARDILDRRDGVRTDTLVHLRMAAAKFQIAAIHQSRRIRRKHAELRHHLRAAGDDDIFQARHDHTGREIDRRDARSAEAIERHAAGAQVIPRLKRRHPSGIAGREAHLIARAPDDVVDIGRVEIVALRNRLEYRRAQHMGVHLVIGPPTRPPAGAGCPAGIDDQSFLHLQPILKLRQQNASS